MLFLCALWVATRRAALPCTVGLGEHVLYIYRLHETAKLGGRHDYGGAATWIGKGISCNLQVAKSSLKGLSEPASKAECEVHTCCVEFGKAYKHMARHLAWQLFQSLGFPYMVLQFITDLYKDTMCAMQMQTDNDTTAICSQIVNGFKRGNVNAPSFLIEKPPGVWTESAGT